MRRSGVTNKIFVGVLTLLFAVVAIVFAMPTSVASANVLVKDNYEDFYSSYMQMISTFDNHESEVSISSVGETDDITRIIVDADRQIVDNNAIYSCSYNGTYFLQYATAEEAATAYEKYENSNFNVMYDYDITTDALEPDEVTEDAGWPTSGRATSKYNSWGWNENTNFMGAVPYLTNLSASVGESNFNKVVVAVLDSGINTAHQLFAGRILLDYGRNFTTETSTGYTFEDKNGHGTHVSGTIAEITPSSVSILPLKVLNGEGKGKVSYIVSALQYMTEVLTLPAGYSLRVANMSLGVESTIPSASLVSYINKAYNQGITCVVSAGNEKQDTANVEPANIENVITVSALARYITGSKMYFDTSYSNFGAAVKFSAPGTSIYSAYIKTGSQSAATAKETLSGTSMAAPHVSAVVALVLTNPNYADLSKGELLNFLKENVDYSKFMKPHPSGSQFDLDTSAAQPWNKYYGFGILNIENLGMTIEGEVTFSKEDEHQATDFSLSLSYDVDSSADIYYTLDENVSASQLTKDSDCMTKYTGPIHITGSSKVTAIAYVDAEAKRSATSSKTYYIDNQDLNSNFAISTNGIITSYYGSLSTLKIGSAIKNSNNVNVTVRSIGANVFSSKVTRITLPNTLTSIGDNAFYANSNLLEVNLPNAEITIGKCAFFKCTKLDLLDTSKVTRVGDSAFAYTLIENYDLSKATTIGNNVFSASQVSKVVFGKNVTIGTQTQIYNLEKVYGYANSAAETFASKYNARFFDLTLKITQDFATKKVVRYGNSLTLTLKFNGYDISLADITIPTSVIASSNLVQNDETSYTLTMQTKTTLAVNNTGFGFSVEITDGESTIHSRNGFKIVVVNSAEYQITSTGSNYQIVVDDEVVSSGYKVYKDVTYTIMVVSAEGYEVRDITIGSNAAIEGVGIDVTVSNNNVVVSATSEELLEFVVHFTSAHGTVKVNGSSVQSKSVDRNGSVAFAIEPEIGYTIKRVVLNEEYLTAVDGVYTISNITSDCEVVVVYENAVYSIVVTYVNACGSLVSGQLNEVDHGETKEITIIAKEGYVVDEVTVNGKKVAVKNGTFEIENIDENKDVVISFRKTKMAIFGGENAVVLDFCFVFGGIFLAFVIARIVLFFVRKYKREKKHY